MLNFIAFTYGLLVVFVLSSVNNNMRANRTHGETLVLVGWGLMSASFVTAALLLAVAAGIVAI